MLDKIEHMSFNNIELLNIKQLIKSPLNLQQYLQTLNIEQLERLFEEAKDDAISLKAYLSEKYSTSETYFHQFMDKISLSDQEKETISVSSLEKFLHFFQKLAEYILGIGGAFFLLITAAIWTIYLMVGATSFISTIVASLDMYSYIKKNNNTVYEKKLLNLRIEILKIINRKKFLDYLNKLALVFEITPFDETLKIKSVPLCWRYFINKINSKNIALLRNKKINKSMMILMDSINSTGIDKSIVVDDNNESLIDRYKSLKNESLTFFQWFNAKKNTIIKRSILSAGLWKAVAIIGVLKIFTEAATLGAIGAFISTPLGMGLIIGFVTFAFITISTIKIYKQYKKAKRDYALEISEITAKEEKNIKNKVYALHEKVENVCNKLNAYRLDPKLITSQNDEPFINGFQNNKNLRNGETRSHKAIPKKFYTRNSSQRGIYFYPNSPKSLYDRKDNCSRKFKTPTSITEAYGIPNHL